MTNPLRGAAIPGDLSQPKKRATRKLTLWVMDDLLTDYASGMVCVLALSEQHAWELLEQEDAGVAKSCRRDGATFEQVTTPSVYVCWGGG